MSDAGEHSGIPPDTDFSEGRPSRFDIASVLYLLSSPRSPLSLTLPPELALDIIDFAQYWQPWTTCRMAERCIPNYNENVLYLSTPCLPSSAIGTLKQLVFNVQSFGRFNAHQTYFEAALVHARWRMEVQMLDGESANLFEADEKIYQDKEALQIEELGRRYFLFSNEVSISRFVNYTHHERRFDADCPLLRDATPGTQIGVFARAVAPGWVNFVKEMTCTIYIAWT